MGSKKTQNGTHFTPRKMFEMGPIVLIGKMVEMGLIVLVGEVGYRPMIRMGKMFDIGPMSNMVNM